jgi:tetratricopeptide (TPR) repeat protein
MAGGALFVVLALAAAEGGSDGFSTLLREGSDDARACYLAAENQDVVGGLPHCDAAIEDKTQDVHNLAASHVNRGILYIWNRHYQDALKDFNTALQIRPDNAEAFANRANVFTMQRRYSVAITDYSRAIELHSHKLFAVYYGRGVAYEATGKYAEAEKDYRMALELEPDFEPAKNALAAHKRPS